jgi:hypothetical protein
MATKGPRPVPTSIRFERYVDKSGGPDACWLWTGARGRKGYGQFYVEPGKAPAKAHRFAWEQANGPIPDGLHVLHGCDNPPCVNPACLFLGTNADNQADMRSKGRGSTPPHRRGAAHWNAKLDEAAVRRARERHATGETNESIALALGVSRDCIRDIVKRRSWRHI